jgi:hypothetical protein
MLVQDEFSAGHGFNVNWNENGNFNLNGNNDKSNVNANNRGVRPVLALSFLNVIDILYIKVLRPCGRLSFYSIF